jgi:hypothetical protein
MNNDFNNTLTVYQTPPLSPKPPTYEDITIDTNFDLSLDFNRFYPIPGRCQKEGEHADDDNSSDDSDDNSDEEETGLTWKEKEKRRRKNERRQKAFEWTEKARRNAEQAMQPRDINEMKLKVFISFLY